MYRAAKQYLTIVHLYKCIITKKIVNYCKLNNIEGKKHQKNDLTMCLS
jgi:hypothetical protein